VSRFGAIGSLSSGAICLFADVSAEQGRAASEPIAKARTRIEPISGCTPDDTWGAFCMGR